MSNIAGAL